MGRTGDHTDGQTRHTIGRQWDDGRTEPKSDRDDIRNAQPRQWQQPNDGTWTPKSDRDSDLMELEWWPTNSSPVGQR